MSGRPDRFDEFRAATFMPDVITALLVGAAVLYLVSAVLWPERF
ncbi:MAG: hypothetical protein ACREFX_13945 [Opitutaceae bacterium]